MEDGLIFKLTITKTGHRPSQIKKLSDDRPVLCADKNYGCLDEVFCTGRDKVENDFIPAYPNELSKYCYLLALFGSCLLWLFVTS